MNISIKAFKKEHTDFLFDLMNDLSIRKFSHNPKQFTRKVHLNFLKNFKGKIFIIYLGLSPVGMIRHREDGEISTALLPECQGKGIGSKALAKYCKNKKGLRAEINPNNKASIKVYEKAGFRLGYYVYKK